MGGTSTVYSKNKKIFLRPPRNLTKWRIHKDFIAPTPENFYFPSTDFNLCCFFFFFRLKFMFFFFPLIFFFFFLVEIGFFLLKRGKGLCVMINKITSLGQWARVYSNFIVVHFNTLHNFFTYFLSNPLTLVQNILLQFPWHSSPIKTSQLQGFHDLLYCATLCHVIIIYKL